MVSGVVHRKKTHLSKQRSASLGVEHQETLYYPYPSQNLDLLYHFTSYSCPLFPNPTYPWGLYCGTPEGPLVGLTSKDSLYLGTHFFGFFQTLFTLPWMPKPQFISVGFVDDIQFERFNSRRDVQRTEHCAPWKDQKKPEYWKDNTDLVLSYFQDLTEILQRMLKIYNYSLTGE